jgi:hypothetical protein
MANRRPLVGDPISDKKRLDELILEEWDPRYSRTAVELTAGTYEIGEVLVNKTVGDSVVGAQPSFSDSICIENITVPASETWEVAALVRGPALLNLDAVKRASDNESDSALITRLADLLAQGVRFVREPVYSTVTDTDG